MSGEGWVITDIIHHDGRPADFVSHRALLDLVLPDLAHLLPLLHDSHQGLRVRGEEGLLLGLVNLEFVRAVIQQRLPALVEQAPVLEDGSAEDVDAGKAAPVEPLVQQRG